MKYDDALFLLLLAVFALIGIALLVSGAVRYRADHRH
jgi:hypothetical protein